MSVKNGQLVRLYDGTETAIENLISGSSVVAGVSLPGLGLGETDYKTWTSTDISTTTLQSANVIKRNTFIGSNIEKIEFNDGNLIVSPDQELLAVSYTHLTLPTKRIV